MTRDEFESLLEEAFMAGYNDAIDEVFGEESSFDLEDEMNAYTENTNRKHPERGLLSRSSRLMSRMTGLDKEHFYGAAAAGAKSINKSGEKDLRKLSTIAAKAGTKYLKDKVGGNALINASAKAKEYLTKRGYKDLDQKGYERYIADKVTSNKKW